MTRSGDEPAHARSPLRLRLGLALFGLACGAVGVVGFGLDHLSAAAIASAVVGVIAAVDAGVIRRHQKQGAHWQPGRDVPAYRPVESAASPRPHREAPPIATRRREYLIMMAVCLVLLIVAWGWVRLVSTPVAVGMSLVAMVIPPIAAVVANAGSHPGPQEPPAGRPRRPSGDD